jgi:alginate O-acetyltransferase complex protein AlgI
LAGRKAGFGLGSLWYNDANLAASCLSCPLVADLGAAKRPAFYSGFMIFNTLAYFFFFLFPSAILFRVCKPAYRSWILTLSGILFFAYFSLTSIGGVLGAACILIILWQSICCVYLCKPNSKFSIFVILQAVLFLCVFKYLNFIGSVLYGKAENAPWYWKDAFLPLGISFFTFEFIHYAADRYKNKASSEPLSYFLSFIFFFPTMVAGPIKRIQDFVPKLMEPSTDWQNDFSRGITRILVGLVRKFAVADVLTALTDHLNANDIAQAPGRATLLLWIFAYGLKIYFDFSAYSDIAIGSARLFGIKVPENFDLPYIRTNIALFWQHWHISLYRWLFDYIYIPLGGSRVASWAIYRNLIVVMLVSGIWHGAGFNFLLWGGWNALLLCIHRLWSQRPAAVKAREIAKASGEEIKSSWLVTTLSWIITYITVNIGWIFFSMDHNTSMLFIRRLLMG